MLYLYIKGRGFKLPLATDEEGFPEMLPPHFPWNLVSRKDVR